MLTGPRQKFAEGVATGQTAADAARAAYPRSTAASARKNASRLLADAAVSVEIERLRAAAQREAGGAVLTLIEKRSRLAAIVRARNGFSEDGDAVETRDKLAAMKLDNELAGDDAAEGVEIVVRIGGAPSDTGPC